MTSKLRAGVIGAGVFGGYHAAKYVELDGVTLTAVLDPHPERAAALAERTRARPVADMAEFLSLVDVVSVAAPAVEHGALALAALRAGKHLYVEKPLATALDDADSIAALALSRGLTVACGFLERAAFAALGLFEVPRPPLRMEATRLGPPSPRNLDVSVVIDLMIHDLDLALSLTGAAPLAVEAEGRRVSHTLLDDVEAEVVFEDGFTAAFRASRVADDRARTLSLFYPTGEVSLDLISGAFNNSTGYALDPRWEETPAGRDRLGASLSAFLAAVRGEAPRSLADAADGARALDLALAVEQAVGG